MTRGSVIKIVNSYGSTWGRIQPDGGAPEVFFNTPSFDQAIDFASIEVGQAVEFDERADPVNGRRADHIVFVAALPVGS